jgi:hypothetical protein
MTNRVSLSPKIYISMSFQSASELAQDPVFQNRVQIAVIIAAKDITSETDTGMVAHAKRQTRAVSVLNYPQAHLIPWALAVASNPSITDQANDGDIQFTVNSLWDGMSGVTEADKTTVYTPGLIPGN